MEKRCCGCRKVKTASAFYRSRIRSDGLHTECKDCSRARAKNYQKSDEAKNRQKLLNKLRNRKYRKEGNIRFIVMRKLNASREMARKFNHEPCKSTIDQLVKLFTTVCQVCDVDVGRSICLDHCHKTGEFRGFVCNGCNSALGWVKDNPHTLLKLASYLTGCEYHPNNWGEGVSL